MLHLPINYKIANETSVLIWGYVKCNKIGCVVMHKLEIQINKQQNFIKSVNIFSIRVEAVSM